MSAVDSSCCSSPWEEEKMSSKLFYECLAYCWFAKSCGYFVFLSIYTQMQILKNWLLYMNRWAFFCFFVKTRAVAIC